MMSEQEITDRLTGAGFKDKEIPTVIRDVERVIIGKVLAAYLATVPESERAQLQSRSAEELQKYLAEHTASLPQFPQSEFNRIHDEMWEDYFKSAA